MVGETVVLFTLAGSESVVSFKLVYVVFGNKISAGGEQTLENFPISTPRAMSLDN